MVQAVRAAIAGKRDDAQVARLVHRFPLAERLEDAAIEVLESEGAGPRTLEELVRWRELSRGMPGRPVRLFDAPPAPSESDRAGVIERARTEALAYHAGIPNFLCTQTVRRYTDRKRTESWSAVDTLTIMLRYSAQQGEEYKLIALDGKPTDRPLETMPGSWSEGEFGSLLHRVFTPSSAADFHWERWAMLRGRLLHVFTYLIDEKHSKYLLDFETGGRRFKIQPAMRGRIFVDPKTGQVMRITWEAASLPPDYAILATPAVLDYDFAEIAGERFLLPSRAESRVVTLWGQSRNITEFSQYRKFASEANITFEKQ